MSLLVLGYPTMAADDLDLIESFRAEHDELYKDVVAAHFTIVFPYTGRPVAQFAAHVEKQAKNLRPVDFVIRCAVLDKDAFNEYTHVFLVPDEGYSDIVKMHDRLYTGILASALRLDISFIPHIGIANAIEPLVAKKLADELNDRDLEISGRIDALDIANYKDDTVTAIERIRLDWSRQADGKLERTAADAAAFGTSTERRLRG